MIETTSGRADRVDETGWTRRVDEMRDREPTTSGSGRRRSAFPRRAAAWVTSALVVAALAPTPAQAGVPRTVDYQLDPSVSRSTSLNYGAARGDSIPIGTNTTRVVIETTDSARDGQLSGDVRCRIYGSHSPSVEDAYDNTTLGGEVVRDWSPAEWADPSSRYLDIPPGVIAQWPGGDPDDYDRYDLFCESGGAPVRRQIERLLWRLTPHEPGAEVLTLTQDPDLLWASESQERYADAGARQDVGSGDLVRLTSPVGTWPTERAVEVAVSGLARPAATVSADGSVVSFRIPPLSRGNGTRPGSIGIRGISTAVAGRAVVQTTVDWSAGVRLREADARRSSTALALDARYGLSVQRLVASVMVSTPESGVGTATGSVVILVDGRRVAAASLDASGSARVRLPPIPRGTHRVTAQYLGDAVTEGSSSPGVWLRILV